MLARKPRSTVSTAHSKAGNAWVDIKTKNDRPKVSSVYGDSKKSAKEKLQDNFRSSENGFGKKTGMNKTSKSEKDELETRPY